MQILTWDDRKNPSQPRALIQIRCYVCTKTSDVSGVILGEVDFLAGAQAKVDAMIAKAKERASKAASRL